MLFEKVVILGFGLIGSSVARAIRAGNLAQTIVAFDVDQSVLDRARQLQLANHYSTKLTDIISDADCIIFCVPTGSYAALGAQLAPHLKPGAIVTDVGSTKRNVIEALKPVLPAANPFVPGHPISGGEKSGPEHGSAEIFKNRWCILTPEAHIPDEAIYKIKGLWEGFQSDVEIMDAAHHDRVLAVTSHLPRLLAFAMMDTAANLETETQEDVIKFAGGGFRDFTRLAASSPYMWRDVFLYNTDAVLEMVQRLSEDLAELQRTVRNKDGQKLFDIFTRANAIGKRVSG